MWRGVASGNFLLKRRVVLGLLPKVIRLAWGPVSCLPGVGDCLQPVVWCLIKFHQICNGHDPLVSQLHYRFFHYSHLYGVLKERYCLSIFFFFFNYSLFLPCSWQRVLIVPPVPSLWLVGFEYLLQMAWNQYPCSDSVIGLFLLLQRQRGVNPLVIPLAAWGRSFYSSGGAGSFFLLCLRKRGVVPFVMPLVARGCSFYSSCGSGSYVLFCLQGRGVWFD